MEPERMPDWEETYLGPMPLTIAEPDNAYVYADPDFIDQPKEHLRNRAILQRGIFNRGGTLRHYDSNGYLKFKAETYENPIVAIPRGKHSMVAHSSKKFPNHIRLDSEILDNAGRTHILLHEPGFSKGCIRFRDPAKVEEYNELVGRNKKHHGQLLGQDLEIEGNDDPQFNRLKPYINRVPLLNKLF
jgi:hypothetical protein